jgi:hypothetical protein
MPERMHELEVGSGGLETGSKPSSSKLSRKNTAGTPAEEPQPVELGAGLEVDGITKSTTGGATER